VPVGVLIAGTALAMPVGMSLTAPLRNPYVALGVGAAVLAGVAIYNWPESTEPGYASGAPTDASGTGSLDISTPADPSQFDPEDEDSPARKGSDHVVLGKSIGLEGRAAAIGGRHLMNPGTQNWRSAVLQAIENPNTKISVDVAGLEGTGSVYSRVMAAVQRGAGGTGSPFDWELAQLRQSGRLSSVDFFENANAIANPFR
jgi:hypothetical protein